MLKLTLEVRDITKANKVVGIGTTLHKFVDDNGKDVYLPCVSYHLPTHFNHSGSPIDPKTMVLIWDTGASAGLTPFRSDFIDYNKVDFGS